MIKYNNVSFGYTKTKIINGVNVAFEDHKFNVIIGPNGSGKTTLLNLLTNIYKKYDGTIKIDEKLVKDINNKDLAKIVSFVPQKINFPEYTYVKDVIMLGRFPYSNRFGVNTKEDVEIAKSYADKMKILDLWEKDFSSISGGQKQRVIIAMALAQETPYIILDEPTNHLDINSQILTLNLLKKLQASENKTTIVCMHDINLATTYADTLFVLKDGKIHKSGNSKIVTEKLIKDVYGIKVSIKEHGMVPIIVGFGEIVSSKKRKKKSNGK